MTLRFTPIIALTFAAFTTFGQTPCENGLAGGVYPCNQTILMGHLSPEDLMATFHNGFYLNDIWGWTDPETQDEYAIVGLTDGVAFVRITDPVNPLMLGKLNETPIPAGSRVMHGESSWRDIKVYQNHAFIVSDLNYEHGMQVFDLTKLRSLTSNQGDSFEPDFLYDGVASSHNIAINEETGYAYIVGSNRNTNPDKWCNGLHILNIQNPKNPVFVACYDADGYSHDAQIVVYQGADTNYVGKEICFGSNEDTFTIFDVDDKSNISIISRNGYEDHRYTHQGWLTEDHRYFLMNDELDESAFGHNPRTFIWDVTDLDAPILIGSFFNEAKAIDHNLYTHQGLAFESNYLSGLRVLDLQRVSDGVLREVAFFDTYPAADLIDFGGTWSNYPYFESGNIVISDMNNGLFIVQLDLQPIITGHPDDSVFLNEESRFTVEVSDPNATFQWQRLNTYQFSNIFDNQKYSGTTTSELITTLGSADKEHIFRCVVTGSDGRKHYSYPSLKAGKARETETPLGLEAAIQTLYPNPVKDAFSLEMESDGVFEIIDLTGKVLKKGALNAAINQIPVSDLESGVFFVRIQSQEATSTLRLIKE